MDSDQYERRVEGEFGDLIHKHARQLGADAWHRIFAIVMSGEFGDDDDSVE